MRAALFILLASFAVIAAAQTFTVTAYCACKECCGSQARGLTASLVRPKQGVTVAGPRNLPFGTRVWIEDQGWYVVQDRTALKYDGRFDIYFRSHRAAKKFGIRQLRVFRAI